MSAFFVLVILIEQKTIVFANSGFYKETLQKTSTSQKNSDIIELPVSKNETASSLKKGGDVLQPRSTVDLSNKNCTSEQLSPAQSATVKWVYDGDTLLLTNKLKIRIIGIDTPETKHHRQNAEAYGTKAKEALRELLKKHHYKVLLRYGKEKQDRYKRTLAHVFLSDGTNISNWLLERGYAKALAYPPNVLLADCYRQSEAYAQAKSLRIWKYKKNSLKDATTLPLRTKGYVRLQGAVRRIFTSRKSKIIELESNFKRHIQLKIKKKNLAYFKSYNIDKLGNKFISVSGILKKKHNKRTIYLNHPSQVKISQRKSIPRSLAKTKRGTNKVTPILEWSSNNDNEKKN